MIQFNLLPAVKLDYVKTKRNKRLTVLASVLVGGVSLAILAILFIAVQGAQRKYSRDLSKDIKAESAKMESIPDLNKILTIQNQLNSLPSLHDKKPAASQLFTYLKQVTPAKVSIANLQIDFDAQTMTITGSADSINSVNIFVDTLKFTTYTASGGSSTNAFSDVVLSSFGRDDKGASYSITLKFDPVIFDTTKQVTLTVPQGKITTRSETEKPEALFQPLSNTGAKP
jgi:Tfp pilus assembly protein PilN